MIWDVLKIIRNNLARLSLGFVIFCRNNKNICDLREKIKKLLKVGGKNWIFYKKTNKIKCSCI